MAIVEDPEGDEVAALAAVVPTFASRCVLEIGCGDGRLTRRYAGTAGSVIAIDPDAKAIASLRRELPQVDARATGIEDLRLPDHSIDIVLFAWSL
jgi:ubiquinone/menaquinone biosynthesis C-methylase UbiE